MFGSNPKDVLSKYLNATLNLQYEEGYKYISNKDKEVKQLKEFLSEYEQEDTPLVKALQDKSSYEIKGVIVNGNQAIANVELVIPDVISILGDFKGAAFTSALGEEKNDNEIAKVLAEKYKNTDLPMTTIPETYKLVKQADGWKIFLDWETEKMEAEWKEKMEAEKDGSWKKEKICFIQLKMFQANGRQVALPQKQQTLSSNNELGKRTRNSMNKSVWAIILILQVFAPTIWADDYIYDESYGGKKVGRVDEDGYVYDKAYGGKKIGRVKDGKVYDKAYGGKSVGRIAEDGKLYDEPYAGEPVGRYKGGKVYDGPYGGSVIGESDSKDGAGYWLLEEGEEWKSWWWEIILPKRLSKNPKTLILCFVTIWFENT